MGDLHACELVTHEEDYLGCRVRSLLERLATKDAHTEGHTRRVAMLGVEVGDVMGLSAPDLRRLAIAGLMHDIGKLRVPDAILKKRTASRMRSSRSSARTRSGVPSPWTSSADSIQRSGR